MRKFMKSMTAAALGFGLAMAVAPADAQEKKVLKMQATWPASLTLYENFTMWAERVDKLSGGTLKIEAMPAGQVVPAFEVLDATHKKVLDGAHAWGGYWTGKDKTSILFTGGPGGTFGMDFTDFMGWMYYGGGWELQQEFYQKQLKLNVVAFPILPSGPQAFGWFKKPIQTVEDMKGMKCRQTGMAGEVWQAMGFTVVNMPGGEIIPSAQRGVIDCAEWVGGVEDMRLGFHNVWKYHYSPGVHENTTVGEILINGDVWKSLTPQQQEIDQVGCQRDVRDLARQVAAPERRRPQGDAGEARRADSAHAARDPDRLHQEVGRDCGRRKRQEPVLQEGSRQPARVRVAGGALQAVLLPAVLVHGQLLFPGEEVTPDKCGDRAGLALSLWGT